MLSVGLQVIAPRVKAYLYTWGQARGTHEGERIPAKIEELDIGYIDGMLLLPLVEEHNIDERSPLCGHTHQSLMEVQFHSYQSHCSVGLVTHTVAKYCYTLQCLVSLQIILWPNNAMPCVVHTACMLPLFHTHSSCASYHAVASSAFGIGEGQHLPSADCCCDSLHPWPDIADTGLLLRCCVLPDTACLCLLLQTHIDGQMLD